MVVFDDDFIYLNRPLLYLHSSETIFPSDIEDYLQRCTLNLALGPQKGDLVVPDDVRLSSAFLDQFVAPTTERLTLQLRPEEAVWRRGDTRLAQVPLYAYAPPGVVDGKRYLHYIHFYPANADFDVVLKVVQIGSHDADYEHVTYEVDDATGRIERIYFAAHGAGDGRWVRYEGAEKNGLRPVVYVAVGSHASYPRTGVYLRFGGAANDRCNRGPLWDPERVVRLVDPDSDGYDPATMGFLRYTGDWGFGAVASLHEKSWWKAEGAASETENKAPPHSNVNFKLDTFVIVIISLTVLALAIVGWVMWSRHSKHLREEKATAKQA